MSLRFVVIQRRCQKSPTWMRDKIAPAGPDRVRSPAIAVSPFLLRRRSIPEYRSSTQHGFGRPDDKARLVALREKFGATSSCPTNHRNEETNVYRKFSDRVAD